MPRRAVYEPKDKTRGDFWLWACIDADTKLVFWHKVGKRDRWTGEAFVKDVRARVSGHVQIATDNFKQYPWHIRNAFGYEGFSYGMETKVFGEPEMLHGTLARFGKTPDVQESSCCNLSRSFDRLLLVPRPEPTDALYEKPYPNRGNTLRFHMTYIV
jgi:IS1 family transposase